MKKLLKVLVVCLALALTLAGCGSNNNGGGTNEGGQTGGENGGIPMDQTLIMVTTRIRRASTRILSPMTARGRSIRTSSTVWLNQVLKLQLTQTWLSRMNSVKMV